MGSILVESEAWVTARDRFIEDLSEEEKALYFNATLENIFYTASNAERSNAASVSRRLATNLSRFLDSINQYGDALDVYANASSTFLCPIWGSIRIVMHVSVSICTSSLWR